MRIPSRHPARRARSGTLDPVVARAATAVRHQRATMMVAIGTRRGPVDRTGASREIDPEVGVAAETVGSLVDRAEAFAAAHDQPTPRSVGSRGIVLLAGLTPTGALDLLDVVAADARLVCATWIREPTQPQFAAVRAIERARLEPNGLQANLAPFDGTADAAAAVLALHMSVLRRRTPAQRKAADALREHGSVKAAARALECQHQTVSRLLHRADTRTTDATIVALLAALPPSLRGSA